MFAYFRESLPVRSISNPYLNECLIFEVSVYNKKGYVVPLYRLPSQTSDLFETFLANLEKLISNISSGHSDFVLLIGDFNAKSRNWSNHDITTTNPAQKMKFSIKDFFSKCDQIRRDLVTFTEEILNGKLYFLCSENQHN